MKEFYVRKWIYPKRYRKAHYVEVTFEKDEFTGFYADFSVSNSYSTRTQLDFSASTPKEKKRALKRLNKIIKQLNKFREAIEEYEFTQEDN